MTGLMVRDETDQAAIEAVIFKGDLKQLSPQERVDYYVNVCRSLGLNPFTRPFDYIEMKGKLTLYALRGCTDQLREINHIDITGIDKQRDGDLYIVTVTGRDSKGRTDQEIGAVSIKGLGGEDLANAMMKAITKAKRRLTLSICGLGWLDETEVETISGAQYGDAYSGELVDAGVVDGSAGGQRPALRPGGTTGYSPEASPQQLRYIHRLKQEHQWSDNELHGLIDESFGYDSLTQLTKQQASVVIERIQSGPRWVDPRQQQLDMSASPPEPEVIDAAAVEVVDGVPDDVRAFADFQDRLTGAQTANELNAVWRDVINEQWNQNTELYDLYERRRKELGRTNGNGGRG